VEVAPQCRGEAGQNKTIANGKREFVPRRHDRMKFAPNRLYIEEYVKCANCGVLIYEEHGAEKPQTITKDGKVYCSQWCFDWEQARKSEKPTAVAPARSP
jgi:hypothetical protein